MTYEEFKNKYNGQYVDVDSYPKDWKWQCFDLAQLYNREVLNVPDYVLAGCEVVKNMLYGEKRKQLDEFFDEVDVERMLPGDVCIWGCGDAGHIAIFDSWDGHDCWYFSQNPNPCQVIPIVLDDHHAFRRKKATPPLPPITPTVERDENQNQIEVKVEKLRVRTQPTTDSDVLGFAPMGLYNFYEKAEHDDFTWYRIADNQWIAYNEDWENIYPAKPKEKFIELKVLDKKDGYVLVDLGKVWIKKD